MNQQLANPRQAAESLSSWRLAGGVLLIACLAYACLDTEPLYAENQNTKFLYGLAKARVGRLEDDWLVGKGSQLPIFDAFVYLTHAYAGSWFFYVWHLVMLTAYAAALYGLARIVGLTHPELLGPGGRWFLPIFGIWFVLMNTGHGTLKALFGVANQHINGHYFEPQSIGVLALLGLLLFRLRQTGWAVVLITAAAWMHPPYALAGLMILAGFAVARMRFGDSVDAPLLVLAAGAVGCLAAAAFTYSLLLPSEPAVKAEALRIITDIRIPHHSWPSKWFDDDAIIKITVLCLVLWLTRRDPLGWVLATVTASVVLLTLWVHFTHDAALAPAAPWRASTIVVPAGAAILCGRVVQWIAGWTSGVDWRRQAAIGVAALFLVLALVRGTQNRIDFFRMRSLEPAYYSWVRDNARDGDVFLTNIWDEKFRLATGQPQYVTWKTHPHRFEAVLEWYDRTQRATALIDAAGPSCALLESLVGEGVTHLVRSVSQTDLKCRNWRLVYEDAQARIYTRRP